MDLSASAREDQFSPESFFSKQDLPRVPNENPETYCRLCLTTPEVEPLFPVSGEPNVYVMELIGKYIGIGLTIQDDYPCAVCRPCHLILDQFDLFRQNCLKVDIAIRRRRLGLDRPSVEVKSEPQDEEDDEEEMPYIRVERNHYQCRFCTETFRSLAMFLTHCKEDHPEESRMFKCKQCNKSFMTKTARLQHIRSHQPNNGESELTGDRVQVCEKCMVTFDSYKLLKIHLKDHHSNDPKQDTLVCSTCSKQFSRITILRNHILRVHLGKLPHACKHCGVSFAYTQQLINHLKDQHGIIVENPLNQSGHSSNAEDDLEQPEELPQYIPVIPKPSASDPQHQEGQLPMSLVAETPPQNRNLYTCSECSAQCASTEDLRTHKKLHQDPTWWKCTHCRNFVKHQKMHLMKKHPSIDAEHAESSFLLRYRCWLCRVYFKSLQQMEQHVAARHGVVLPPSLSSSGTNQPDENPDVEGEAEQSAGSMMPPPARPVEAAPPIPLPLTVQPPGLPFLPEHLPLLLSQMENGAWDYLREMSRLMDPANLAAFAAAMKIKTELPEPLDAAGGSAPSAVDVDDDEYDDGVVDLSTNSTASMSSTFAGDDTLLDQDDEQDSSEEEHNYIRLDNRLYQCRFCSETFRHLLLIRKHTKSAHPTEWKSFKCPHCKRRFPSAAIRDRHAHFHTLQHQFVCGSCDQMYDSKKRLEQHTSSVHDPASSNYTAERLRCGACRLSFTEKKYFDMHLKIYHQRKPQRLKNLTDRLQVCERCVTTFESRESLQEHVRQVHKTDQPLRSCECPKCGKDLKTTTLLRTHILVVHLGHLPFVCQHCEAAFSTRHWLLKHIEKDHAEAAASTTVLEGTDFIVINQPAAPPPPPTTMIEAQTGAASATAVSQKQPPSIPPMAFKCTGCEEYFENEYQLDVHVNLVHAAAPPKVVIDPESGQSRLACGKCERLYPNQDELEKHVIKAHPTFMLLYKCPLCVKPIRYRKQHMRVHHDVEYDSKEHHYLTRYKCHCCSKLFKSKRNLTSHQNALLFQCDKCHMRFKSKKSFQAHAAIHRSNKSMLKCADCGLEFGYRARLEDHRNRYHSPNSKEVLKLLHCPYCPRLFISASNRERHITITHPQSGFLVSCGHCEDMRCSDSSIIRKHYREVHPNERVTFKCAECVNKIYLNFSSYKDHYKAKHGAIGSCSDQSFSGESSSAAESSFNGSHDGTGGVQIKQEADIFPEDTKLIEDNVAVKVEPPSGEEEEKMAVQPEVSDEGAIVQKLPSDDAEVVSETPSEDAKVVSETPSEDVHAEVVQTEVSESQDQSKSVELLSEPEPAADNEVEPKENDLEIKQDIDPPEEADTTTEEISPIKSEPDLIQDPHLGKEVPPSEVESNVPEPGLVKTENEPEASLVTTESDECSNKPIPSEEEHKPETDVVPSDEPNPEPDIIAALAPEVVEPEPEPITPSEEEPAGDSNPPENSEIEPPIEPPEPEAAADQPEQPPAVESDSLPQTDQKSTESDGEGAAGGIAKSAKRARTDQSPPDGSGSAELVDSARNDLSHSTPIKPDCPPAQTLAQEETIDLNLNASVGNKRPPVKRERRKSVRCTTPTWKVRKVGRSRDRMEPAKVESAVIVLPKLETEVEPKLELIDFQVVPNLEPEPEMVPPKLEAVPVVKLTDCLEEVTSSPPKSNKLTRVVVSLHRLDEDLFPPVLNYEVPVKKCIAHCTSRNGATSRNVQDRLPTVPRKKAKLLVPNPCAVKNGTRRLVPRFLTCKRCGNGGIARTLFGAHRSRCLRLRK